MQTGGTVQKVKVHIADEEDEDDELPPRATEAGGNSMLQKASRVQKVQPIDEDDEEVPTRTHRKNQMTGNSLMQKTSKMQKGHVTEEYFTDEYVDGQVGETQEYAWGGHPQQQETVGHSMLQKASTVQKVHVAAKDEGQGMTPLREAEERHARPVEASRLATHRKKFDLEAALVELGATKDDSADMSWSDVNKTLTEIDVELKLMQGGR